MSDLIDREKLKEYWIDKRNNRGRRTATITDFIISVNDQPAIQQERTAEFRNVNLSFGGDDDDTWECSECQQAWIIDGNPKEHHYHFCPNCGARFKEDQDGR